MLIIIIILASKLQCSQHLLFLLPISSLSPSPLCLLVLQEVAVHQYVVFSAHRQLTS
jgi:hypothetical protein